jgi:hypothetical protein
MIHKNLDTLIIGDDELECKCEGKSIDEINISSVGFSIETLEKFDLIIYQGKKGTKIIKSKYTNTGVIKKE